MPALVIPSALQIVLGGANLGTRWVNVLGVKGPGSFLIDQTVADEIGDAVTNAFALWKTALNSGWSMDTIQVRDLRTATSPVFDADFTTFSGTDTAQALPPHLAVVVTHTTGQRGGSYRGRTYLNGCTEACNDGDGTVLTTIRNSAIALFEDINDGLATVTGGPFELAVLSRKLLEANTITAHRCDPEWDRQDRRKRR